MNRMIYVFLIIITLLCLYLVALPTTKENFLINDLKERLTVVDPKFCDLDIREADSSYTEDKTIIYLCLRDPKSGSHYPINTVMYVALHEIAHLLNRKDFGHTEAFHKIFDKLLCKAASKGVYDPSLPHADWYCGVNISNLTMPRCDMEDLNS